MKDFTLLKAPLLTVCLVLAGCAATQEPDMTAAQSLVGQARTQFVADKRTVLLESTPCKQGLCVTTTSREAAAFLSGKPGIAARLLPDASVSETPVALVRVPIASVHSANRFSSEIVTEAVMGTPVKLLEKNGWWRVQTPDGYLGWIHSLQLTPLSDAQRIQWTKEPRLVVTDLSAEVFEKPHGKALVTELPNSSLITRTAASSFRGFLEVALPDHRAGWVRQTAVSDFEAFQGNARKLADNPGTLRSCIADNALRLCGRSYRWAGITSWGLDCSGLVRAALAMTGYLAPRDADQLIHTGEKLSEDAVLQKGDLLFFGKARVNHVAISLGGTRFVHSLGDVHIGDLNPSNPRYIGWARSTFLFAVRPRFDTGCVSVIADVPLVAGASLTPLACPKSNQGTIFAAP